VLERDGAELVLNILQVLNFPWIGGKARHGFLLQVSRPTGRSAICLWRPPRQDTFGLSW